MDRSFGSSIYVLDIILRLVTQVASSREIVAICGYLDEPGQAVLGRVVAVREDSLELMAVEPEHLISENPIQIDFENIERIERDSVEILALERNQYFASEEVSANPATATEENDIYNLLLEAIRLKQLVQVTTISKDRFFAIPESLIGPLLIADRVSPVLALRDANLYVPLDQIVEVQMNGPQESIIAQRMMLAA